MIFCPNKNDSNFQKLEQAVGTNNAYAAWHRNSGSPLHLDKEGKENPLYTTILNTIAQENETKALQYTARALEPDFQKRTGLDVNALMTEKPAEVQPQINHLLTALQTEQNLQGSYIHDFEKSSRYITFTKELDNEAAWREAQESLPEQRRLRGSQHTVLQNIQNILRRVSYDRNLKKYFVDGKDVKRRVSDLVDKYKRRRWSFSKVFAKESEQEITHYALKGTVLHEYLRNLVNRVRDGEKIRYSDVLDSVMSELKRADDFAGKSAGFFRLTNTQFASLAQKAEDIVNRFDSLQKQIDSEGNFEIFTELMVFDEKQNMAGTIDLAVVFSDGTMGVYDYKSMVRLDEKQIPVWRTEQWEVQLSAYTRMAMDVFGATRVREARIIPMAMSVSGKTQDGFTSLEVDTSILRKEYLEDVPALLERTGDKTLDDQLDVLQRRIENLQAKLRGTKAHEDRSALFLALEKALEGYRKIQMHQDIKGVYKDVNAILKEFEDRKGEPIGSENALEYGEILETQALIEIYKDFFAVTMESDLAKIKDAEVKEKARRAYNNMTGRLIRAEKEIGALLRSIFLAEENVDIKGTFREVPLLRTIFNQPSHFKRPQWKILSNLIMGMEAHVMRMMDTINDNIGRKSRILADWAKKNNMSEYEAQQLMIDEKGQLKRKWSGVYGEEKAEARKNKDIKWFLKNTNVGIVNRKLVYKDEESQQKFEEFKERAFETINRKYPERNDPERNNREKIRWEKRYNITVNPEALFKDARYIKPNNDSRFHSEFWNYMQRPENKPLLEFYSMVVNYNHKVAEITGIDVRDNFVPEIHKDVIDAIATNGFSGLRRMRQTIANSWEIREYDILKGSFDPVTGEVIPTIPLLFTQPITKSLSQKEHDAVVQEVLKEVPNRNTQEFEDLLRRRVYEKERELGLKFRSTDLSRTLSLFMQSAFTHAYWKDREDYVKMLSLSMRDSSLTKTELIDSKGKRAFNDFTKKVLTKIGVPTNEANAFEAHIKRHVYGQHLQQGLGAYEKDGRTYSYDKVAKDVLSYVGLTGLALSPIVAAGNSIQTFQGLMVKAAEGQWFTKEQVRIAQKLWMTNSREANILAGYFKPFVYNVMRKEANKLSAKKLSRWFTMENAYILQEYPDRIADVIGGLALLQNFTVHNGVIKRLAKVREMNPDAKSILDSIEIKNDQVHIEGISNNEANFIRIRKMMQKVSSRYKGMVPANDQNLIGTNLYLSAVMQFRNWIPPLLRDRTMKLQYDEDLQMFDIGRYRVFFGELTAKGLIPKLTALKDSIFEVAAFGAYNRYSKYLKGGAKEGQLSDMHIAKRHFEKFLEENPELRGELTIEDFIDVRARKIQGMARELRGLLAYAAIIFMLGSHFKKDIDEEQPELAEYLLMDNAYRYANRGLLEMTFFLDIQSALTILSTPAAAMRVVQNLSRLITALRSTFRYATTGEQRRYMEAWQRAGKIAISHVPGARAILDFGVYEAMMEFLYE